MIKLRSNNLPRRGNLNFLIPAEKLIYEANWAIEALGADVRLTEAQIKLQEAAKLLSDFVDDEI